MPEAASSVAAWSTEQMMLEIIQVRIATGVTRVVWTAVVLRCGKQMEKLPHYYFSWIVSFQKQRYHICEMLPLETKLSGDILLPQLALQGGSVSRWNLFTKMCIVLKRLLSWTNFLLNRWGDICTSLLCYTVHMLCGEWTVYFMVTPCIKQCWNLFTTNWCT